MNFNFYAVKKFEDPKVTVKRGPFPNLKEARKAALKAGLRGAKIEKVVVIPLRLIKFVDHA